MDSHVDSIYKFWVAYLYTYLFIHFMYKYIFMYFIEVLVGPTILYIILDIAVCTCQSQIPSLSIPPFLLLVLNKNIGQEISRK